MTTNQQPKIYVYIERAKGNIDGPANPSLGVEHYDGEVIGVAVAEDGEVLAGHLSSNREWFRHDMGLTSDWKHERYREKYPDGFTLVEGPPPTPQSEQQA